MQRIFCEVWQQVHLVMGWEEQHPSCGNTDEIRLLILLTPAVGAAESNIVLTTLNVEYYMY
jgi:hypothetical protein